jgi:glycogen debranching enzyme
VKAVGVARRDGSLPIGEPHPLGLYLDDCRFLCGHELYLNGARPRLLVASAALGSESVHELTNPRQTLRLRLERRLVERAVEETVVVQSYDREPLEIELELRLSADFEPMLAIRGMVAVGEARGVEIEHSARGVRFATVGRDGRHRATTVVADSDCESGSRPGDLRWPLTLGPSGETTLRLRYELHEGAGADRGALRTPPRRVGPDEWLAEGTVVETDDELFNRILRRSLLDIRMLRSRHEDDDYYAAGVPWYATLFGRDSLITATQLLAFDPPMAEGTLRVLANLIGTRDDAEHDEEPGKVLHELRVGEVANLGLSPFARYYGTVDATPLFLSLLTEHADWTGDLSLFRDLRPQIDAMLGWIDGAGDRDGDGLLFYRARTPAGLRNQGWKDSEEGVLGAAGAPLEPPITLVEPSAYALRAKRRLAALFELDGDEARAQQLRAEAGALGEALDRFWLEDRGFYSMGWGADGVPSGALASNQSHLLWSGAVPPPRAREGGTASRARAIRDAVMSPAMFSGWGIRTLGEGEGGYNPVGYHLGTVWPHDTAMTALGLRKYGFDEDFARIFEALLDAAAGAPDYRLPELFAGFSRTEIDAPVPYPVACRPQAWAAGSIPYLTTGGLGLVPDGLNGRLWVRRPWLPRWLDRVVVRGLRVAGSRVDLTFERSGGLTDVSVDGDLEVVVRD